MRSWFDTPRKRGMAILGVVLLAVVLYLPQYYPKFRVVQFSDVVITAIAVLGLGLLTGYNGQISVGHAAFFGVGAYTTAILVDNHGWAFLATIPVAVALSFFVGVLTGIPGLRIKGLYLALVTLALATLFPFVIQRFSDTTGGSTGKSIPDFDAPEWTGLADDQWVYYVLVAFAIPMFVLVRNLIKSRAGRAIIAIRDNETAAEVVGINLAIYKVMTFGISASIAGLAGSLSMIVGSGRVDLGRDGSVVLESIQFLAAMVIGGAATIAGPVLGALFVVFTPEFAEDVDPQLSQVIYGALLILMMLVLPSGIMGGIRRLEAFTLRKLGRDAQWRALGPGPEGDDDAASTTTSEPGAADSGHESIAPDHPPNQGEEDQ
jgi:branched-chain amino acid transport system permease protein